MQERLICKDGEGAHSAGGERLLVKARPDTGQFSLCMPNVPVLQNREQAMVVWIAGTLKRAQKLLLF